MNPNDIYAQQQVIMNQAQHVFWAFLVIYGAMFVFGVWVVYMFYARLRDIADELRKLRIAFEFAEDRKARAAKPTPPRASDESRYTPKS
jgi:hypothetical protein